MVPEHDMAKCIFIVCSCIDWIIPDRRNISPLCWLSRLEHAIHCLHHIFCWVSFDGLGSGM